MSEMGRRDIRLGLDCHTMAAIGPPIGPLAGRERPFICLSNGKRTCPSSWIESLADCLEGTFNVSVSINRPFQGGYIIRRYSTTLPWIQIELSRAPFLPNDEKRARLHAAMTEWCRRPLTQHRR
jgi:formiminoglutamase